MTKTWTCTLIGLKRLMDVVEDVGGRLSVILAGHPKLRNDLRRPTMEEIGYRTDVFNLDGIAVSQRDYIHWLPAASLSCEFVVTYYERAFYDAMVASKMKKERQVRDSKASAL